MIDRIGTIYEEIYGKSTMADIEDKRLSEKVNELLTDADNCGKLNREKVYDLVFAGSSTGQAHGFREGFRFAFALIFESLVD